MDQRSGDGPFGGRLKNHRAQFRVFYLFPEEGDAGCEDCVCSERDHPEFILQEKRSVWRNRKLRKMIGSFAEDRSLTCSATTSGYWRS